MGLAKPESKIILYYAKCRIKGCEEPYTIMHTSKVDAERSWFHHAFALHRGQIKKIPPFLIKEKNFKAVKD